MFNLDDTINEHNEEHNLKWPRFRKNLLHPL